MFVLVDKSKVKKDPSKGNEKLAWYPLEKSLQTQAQ
jgi:hypothetical protein